MHHCRQQRLPCTTSATSMSNLVVPLLVTFSIISFLSIFPTTEALSEQFQNNENFHHYDLTLPAAAAAAASYFGRAAAAHELRQQQLPYWSPVTSSLLNVPSSSPRHYQISQTPPSSIVAAQLVAANPEFGLNSPASPVDQNSIANSIQNGNYHQSSPQLAVAQQTEVEYQQQNNQNQNQHNNNNAQQQQAQHLQQEAEQLHELQQQHAQQAQQNQQQQYQQQQQKQQNQLPLEISSAAVIRPAASPIHFQPHELWHPSVIAAAQQRSVFPTTTSYLAVPSTTVEPPYEQNSNNNQQIGSLIHAMSLTPSQAANAANYLNGNHPSTWQQDGLVTALMDPHNRDVAIMLLSLMTMSAGTALPPAHGFAGGNNPSNSASSNNAIMAAQQQSLLPPTSSQPLQQPQSKRIDSNSAAAVMSDAVVAIEHHLQQQQQQKPANVFYGPAAHPAASANSNAVASGGGPAREQQQQQQALLRQRHHLQMPPSANEISQQPAASQQQTVVAQQQHNKKLQQQQQRAAGAEKKVPVSQQVGALQAQATNSVVGGALGTAASGIRAPPLIPTPCDQIGAQSPGGMSVIDPNQQYCTLPGAAYPTAQVGNYIVENLSTMKRMAGSPRIPGNREEDADRSQAMSDGQDQRKKRLAGTGSGTRGKYLCPATEELVTPFWANNATGARLAIVNSPPFEQAVHTVKCTRGAQGRCHPTRPCWCTQEYSWFRLLAYDPTDNCKGIFMEWFKFPSSCNCMCY